MCDAYYKLMLCLVYEFEPTLPLNYLFDIEHKVHIMVKLV